MSSINFASKEISVKIVYYGPGLCGKTTTLQYVYTTINPDARPKMVSLATDVDRTIFFDFLPVNAYKVREFLVRLQLYTVPGQVFYNSTRKLVLNGADGVVFVADAQRQALDSNIESYNNLEENLLEQGVSLANMPHIIQYNKQDLPDVIPSEELDQLLNRHHAPYFETTATSGEGVLPALKEISKRVIMDLNRKGLGRRLSQGGSSSSDDDMQVVAASEEFSSPDLNAAGEKLKDSEPSGIAKAITDSMPKPAASEAPTPSQASTQMLKPIWRNERQIELAQKAEQLFVGDDIKGLKIALIELFEECVRYDMHQAAQTWDSAQCALYKGIPGHTWKQMQNLLQGDNEDMRELVFVYLMAAIAIDGWSNIQGSDLLQ